MSGKDLIKKKQNKTYKPYPAQNTEELYTFFFSICFSAFSSAILIIPVPKIGCQIFDDWFILV